MAASPDHGKIDYTLQGVHVPFQWTYADQAARLAAVGFVATDKYKIALQTDDNSVWILTNHSPVTWVAFGGGASGGILDWKSSVRAATTANIVLSGLQTIDGVVLVAADRVLVKNQTTASENGLYSAASGAWTRTTDADVSAEVTPGLAVVVEEGTTLADTAWFLTTNAPITLGSTSLAFTRLSVTAHIDLTGVTSDQHHAQAHDHTAADGSGVLTADEHDSFGEYAEIVTPTTPGANKVRFYAKDDGGVSALFYKRDSGIEVGPLGVGGGGAAGDHNHTATGDGGVLTGARQDSYEEFDEIAAPATPAIGRVRLYATADGHMHQKDDAGVDTDLSLSGDDLLSWILAVTL